MGWHEQETPAGGAATRGHIPQTFHRPHTHVTSKRSHAKPIAALFTAHVLPSLHTPPQKRDNPESVPGTAPQHQARDVGAVGLSLHQTQRHFLQDSPPYGQSLATPEARDSQRTRRREQQ